MRIMWSLSVIATVVKYRKCRKECLILSGIIDTLTGDPSTNWNARCAIGMRLSMTKATGGGINGRHLIAKTLEKNGGPIVVATVGVPFIYGSPRLPPIMSKVTLALTNLNARSARNILQS